MKTFKEFITEEVTGAADANVYFNYKSENLPIKYYQGRRVNTDLLCSDLVKVIKEQCNLNNKWFGDSTTLQCKIQLETAYHGTHIDTLVTKVEEAFFDFMYDHTPEDYWFNAHNIDVQIINTLPEHMKLDYDLISIDPKAKMSLHNIHKQISCGQLNIFEGDKITDCALGLLEIPNLEEIMNIDAAKWLNIVLEHFDSDKDIFACKESLVSAGFKEHAKL